jgi:hypothetical protein
MTSAFVCASLGIVPTVRHADYLGSWLAVLREDSRAIVRAASAWSPDASRRPPCSRRRLRLRDGAHLDRGLGEEIAILGPREGQHCKIGHLRHGGSLSLRHACARRAPSAYGVAGRSRWRANIRGGRLRGRQGGSGEVITVPKVVTCVVSAVAIAILLTA